MIVHQSLPRPDADFAGIIMAAGDSRRMGQPKATMRVLGQPACMRLARACLSAGAKRVLIMVAADVRDEVMGKMPAAAEGDCKMKVVVVPEKLRRLGPAGSVLHGVKNAGETGGWLLWPVDHPFVETATVRDLLEAEGLIRLPRHDGRRGHPIYLQADNRAELIKILERGRTLEDYVRTHVRDVEDVDVNDPGTLWNCDSPATFRSYLAEYERAHARGAR